MDFEDVVEIISQNPSAAWELDRGALRLFARTPELGRRVFCPLTYVVYITTGVYYTPDQWREAARHIGLDPAVASGIVAAAEDPHAEPVLRRYLLRAAGFEAESENLEAEDEDNMLW